MNEQRQTTRTSDRNGMKGDDEDDQCDHQNKTHTALLSLSLLFSFTDDDELGEIKDLMTIQATKRDEKRDRIQGWVYRQGDDDDGLFAHHSDRK